jgi:hypothetical protein
MTGKNVPITVLNRHEQAEINPFAAKQAERAVKRSRCVFCAALERLTDEQLDQFYEAMDNREISSVTIADVLDGWGVDVSQPTLSKHRTRRCRSFAASLAA